MEIYIPSLNRHNEMPEGTIKQLPKAFMDRTTIVCHEQEEEEYRRVQRDFGCKILVLPPALGIERVRRAIAETAALEETRKIVMMDDDIEFYIRLGQDSNRDDWWKLSGCNSAQTASMLGWIRKSLDSHAHVGVSPREGQNRVREAVTHNSRYIRLLAYRTKELLETETGRIDVMEDFDVALQLLRRGLPSAITYRFAQGQAKTQAPGGCSTWRTIEVHNRGAERLKELHPDFVRLRLKQNKTDADGFGTRKECTIYWKKAFASSQKEDETCTS